MINIDVNQQSKVNKVIIYGFVAAIIINLIFFVSDAAKPIGKYQTILCMYLPYLIAMPAIFISVIIKFILRGKVAFREWDIEQAKDILIQKNSILRKMLAGLYLLIYYPIFFLAGWAIGTLIFYYSALALTKK